MQNLKDIIANVMIEIKFKSLWERQNESIPIAPKSKVNKTEEGQAYSVPDLLRRHANGLGLPEERSSVLEHLSEIDILPMYPEFDEVREMRERYDEDMRSFDELRKKADKEYIAKVKSDLKELEVLRSKSDNATI